jgi:uncharacterized protein (DUF362 family)
MTRSTLTRRRFLDAALVLGASSALPWLSGCAATSSDGGDGAGPDPKKPGGKPGGKADDPTALFPAALAGFADEAGRRSSVQRVVEMLGGMPFIKSGDRVLIKPAHNSPYPYPFTASPVSASELARMCLDAGASQVIIADCMGIEHTLVPGGWHLEDPWGNDFDPDDDATILAMHASGFFGGIADAIGAGDVGPDRAVHITSFRELGWRRYESESDTPGTARMVADFVKDEIKNGTGWDGKPEFRVYLPRRFDFLRPDVPGMMLPRVMDEVDHVINLHRVSTHIWSHATHALKNWIGVQRPDERFWMHQLNYLKNRRHSPDDPASTEMPYHEMLAELHMATWKRERMIIADASEIVLSGGPDGTDKPTYPARLMMGATDLVSADVLAIALVKMGVLSAIEAGGLEAVCQPQPQSNLELAFAFLTGALPWRDGPFRGTDKKLCDPTFSPWDWLAIRRARELGMGPRDPSELELLLADGEHAVSPAHGEFVSAEVQKAPAFALEAP